MRRSISWVAVMSVPFLAACGMREPETAVEARARAEVYLAGRCGHLGAAACAAEGYQGTRRQPGVWSVDYCVDGLDIAVIVPHRQPVELSTMARDAPCPAPRED